MCIKVLSSKNNNLTKKSTRYLGSAESELRQTNVVHRLGSHGSVFTSAKMLINF